MKVLVDTNIMLGVILQRENYNVANQLLTALSEGNHIIYMTVGGFYGMLFTVDKYFKKVMGMQEPLRTDTVRSVMTQVLAIVDVAGQDKQTLLNGIHDMNFKDLEDSCQHQAAMKESCDYLLTFNVKDYSGAEIPVLTPQEFVNKIKTE